MKPIIFVIFDGLGDRPIKKLEGMTPLEAAKTPNLDKLAKIGITGLLHTIERGIRPGSDVAHLSLFGYDPRHHYRGRGPFEAFGYGLRLKKGDVAFRANLATVTDKLIVTDRRAERLKDSSAFAKLLNGLVIKNIKVLAKPGLDHRLVIVLRGHNLSDEITDTDPHLVNKPVLKCFPKTPVRGAQFTADLVNQLTDYACRLFKNHSVNQKRIKNGLLPANIILLRGAGKLFSQQKFEDVYGLKACCIAGAGLYKGIAAVLGMDVVDVPGANGKVDTNLKGKIETALKIKNKYDFIFVHIKAADSLAEDGEALLKKNFIEKADRVFSKLIPLCEKREIILSVTADHTTSSELKIHTADEVPLLVSGFGVRTDDVQKFGERPCQKGGLGHMEGRNLIDFLLNLRGQSKLYGN